jgi:predicted hotdog family 3-hydroxylacyl-ACP dehydratase
MMPRDAIADLIPHNGEMCLLDTIERWDRECIVCHTTRHVSANNPLLAQGRLSAIHAIEFAAQAMAAHHRLAGESSGTPRFGLLVSVRQCTFATDRLDKCGSPLVIEAHQLAASPDAITYRFEVGAAGAPVVAGRASIILRDGGAP